MIKKIIIITIILTITTSIYARNKSQCGSVDDRIASNDPAIARTLKDRLATHGCTGTLISRTCMISAGHCQDYSSIIEFNVSPSIDGRIIHPAKEDIYERDRVIRAIHRGAGRDWMVFNIKKNAITGKFPGTIQGYYNFDLEIPEKNINVTITGYGKDARPDRNYAQQTSDGVLVTVEGTILKYVVDTSGGSSGSAVIDTFSNKIIGIHTSAGCRDNDNVVGANKGTMLATSPKLIQAIKQCLEEEALIHSN